MKETKNIESLCVQAGYDPKNGQERIPAISQSITFKYDKTQDVQDLFDLKVPGHFYSRLSNPTVEVLEKKITALEGGIGALALSSGQAAATIAFLTLAQAGDHIVSANNIYGGIHSLLASTLKRMGISTSFVHYDDLAGVEGAIQENTKAIYAETISNPSAEVIDIQGLADIAHRHQIPLIVDNTFATPVLCRPFDYGADLVIHSTSKYIDGHATSIGGIIVDSGNYDWTQGKTPLLTEKDPAYHGLSYTESFGPLAYLTRARAVYLRDLGASLSPFNAFLTNLGAETLALRMERHSENALKVAKFLQGHEKVDWVRYPFLEDSPSYENAKKYLKAGSGVLSFGVKGGREEAARVIDNLNFISLVVHVADVRSHALHPASSTHRQLSDQDLAAAGIDKNLIRLSVGIEDPQDIIEDLDQALRA
ncbi:MAG: O-acetylhomoserine aminocarboxypropyltransferase/cysteine synthase [Peptoniphilus sp. oral taxon 375]|nr:O-acetylhomoserine aminocarboxypropyltransferase [Peptoniphilus sp. oral taxon 375 str. F0436]MBS4871889.1 O-acetylhomoserine aminocarboxypropyltransferase/cysteine synthase [Peptoniphilus sp. oral taxon 375]